MTNRHQKLDYASMSRLELLRRQEYLDERLHQLRDMLGETADAAYEISQRLSPAPACGASTTPDSEHAARLSQR